MVNISFKHGVGDKVYISELERAGYVVGLYYGETGSQYRVSYFDDASKKTEYFSDQEISIMDSRNKRFGFKSPEPTIASPVRAGGGKNDGKKNR